MKKLFRFGLAALSLVAMVIASGCSDKRTSNLLGVVGDDAEAVAFFRPVDLLKSLGAKTDGGTLTAPAAAKEFFPNADVLKFKGIDYNLAAFAAYDDAPNTVMIAAIKDADALASSLKKLDYEENSVGGKDVYMNDGSALLILDGQLIAFDCYDESDLEDYVENIIDRSKKPLDGWKQDLLMARSGKTIYGIIPVDEKIDFIDADFDGMVAFDANLNGTKAEVNVNLYDNKGKVITLSEVLGEDLAPIGNLSEHICNDAQIVYAFGGFIDESIFARFLDFYRMPISDMDNVDLLRGLVANINVNSFDRRGNPDIESMQVSGAVSIAEGKAHRVFKDMIDLLKDVGARVKSKGDEYIITVGETKVTTREDGDVVVFALGDEFHGSHPSVGDCLAYAAINIPADHPLLNQFADLGVGLKGNLKVMESSIHVELDLIDSDQPFLQKLYSVTKDIY